MQSYSGYLMPYTYDRIIADSGEFARCFPGVLSVGVCAKSTKGRDIVLMRIGHGRKKLLAVAGLHAREYVTAGFLMRSIYELCRVYDDGDGEACRLLGEYTLYGVPLCNPDGVEICLHSELPQDFTGGELDRDSYKNNANNVNLNANFPFFWESVPTYREPGRAPASESETRCLISLCGGNRFLRMMSLHMRGACIYWRDCGNGVVPGDETLSYRLGHGAGFELCPPTQSVEDYSGGFENWFRSAFFAPALCVELVRLETLGYKECCSEFDKAVEWDKTRTLLKNFIRG